MERQIQRDRPARPTPVEPPPELPPLEPGEEEPDEEEEPDTAGIRAGFRLYWRWRSSVRGGRPMITQKLRDLIGRVAQDNPD